ncbi:ubiquitin-like protein [Durotheca rogersii]|uniref:ubiquitin-like protein n=1 Tax=Durotheca rogersii TaxID=419775 RepID=UPI00222083EB|nr:ubiquitin-like protein [Durotheca rogersii]KAI5864401.1 ubiquitin-like protein [Durotheca rogersii]
MSDQPASPRRARGDSPPPRKRSRSGDRSQSPRRDRNRRGGRDGRDRAGDRNPDSYRSREEPWRDRRNRNRDDRQDRTGRESDRQDTDREERDSDRRHAGGSEGADQDRPRPKKGLGGFKYKERRRDDAEDGRDGDRRGGSFRGYRNRSPSPRRRDRDRDAGASSSTKKPKSKSKSSGADTSQPPERPPAAPSSGGEEMIIVHVNDRLGTKAAIPCFASDPIKDFKIMVAARIGREPHEILLKRQGQRPFKDMLTLADYEISNGVQLDLEVDTGD